MAARDPLHGLVADETPGGVPAAASWRAVFDHTPAGLVLRNAGGRITDCNAAAERLLGLSRAQLLGQDAIDPAWKALDGQGNALAPEQDPGLQTLRSGQALQCVDFGVEMPGGERRWLSVSTSLLPSEGGVGVVVSFTDDTVHRHLQRAQAEQWQRLRATLDGTRTATWEWNLQTGETRLSERWAEIVGYTLAELSPTTIDTWQALIHPDDTQASTAQWERHLAGELPLFDIECRLRHRDGSWRWVRNRGRLSSTTAEGQPR
jgi:PAS domain S-box-containing protein